MSSVLDSVTTEGSIVLHRFFQQAPKASCLSFGKNKKRMVMSSTWKKKQNRTLLYFCNDTCQCFLASTIPLLLEETPCFPLGVTALLLPHLVWCRPGWLHCPAWGAGLTPDQYFFFLSLVINSVVLAIRSKLWDSGRNLSEIVPSSCWGYVPGTAGSHRILSGESWPENNFIAEESREGKGESWWHSRPLGYSCVWWQILSFPVTWSCCY